MTGVLGEAALSYREEKQAVSYRILRIRRKARQAKCVHRGTV